MAITVKHKFVSAIPDGTDATIVRPSNWNDDHDLTGTIPVTNGGTGQSTATDAFNALAPSQTGNNGKYLTTDGTNTSWSANASGDVVGPASATDNAITRFDGTTGKLIKNSGVTIDANNNIAANALDDAYTNTAASGTLITLTAASPRRYTITGSGGQVIKLPDATTLTSGAVFQFDNNQSSGAITVNNNSNTLVVSVPSGGFVLVNLLSNATAAGSWDRHDQAPANVSWSTNTFDYAGSITSATWNGNVVQVNRGGTGVSTLTGYVKGAGTTALTASSTIPTTDLSGTVTNAQLANSAITINGTSTSLGGSISVGTVTSVAATVPAFLSVTGSPITSSGTLAIAYSGTALPVANGGSGATTLTGLVVGNGTSAMTTVTAPSGAVVGTTDTQTLTNKRITPRVSTTTSSATPTINTDNTDQYGLTAQAVDITSFTTNLSGTPTDGQKLWIYIVGTAARAITWGASFESSTATLPSTTVSTNRLDIGFVWNTATTKWRCVAIA